MKNILLLPVTLILSCTFELKASDANNYNSQSYHVSEPSYYEWTCDDDNYYYESWVDVYAVDCSAFKVTALVETFDFYNSQEDLQYYGDCDWQSYIYLNGVSCYDIYDVRLKSYY